MMVDQRLSNGPTSAAHVFVPSSSDAAVATEVICQELVDQGVPADRILVVWLQSHFREPELPVGIRVELGPANAVVTKSAFQEILKRFEINYWWRSVKKRHNDILGEAAHWYITIPVNVPSNEAFLSKKRLSLSLLPDGLLNYVRSTIVPTSTRNAIRIAMRHSVDVVSAWFVGQRYTPFWSGHLTQFETGRYDRVFTFNPAGLFTVSGIVCSLDRPRTALQSQPNAKIAVIADQGLEHLVHRRDESKLRAGLYHKLNAMDLDRVVYKKHPRGPDRSAECRSALRYEVETSTTTGPVEDLVASLGACVLASYYSASLIYALDPPGLHRIAVMPTDGQGINGSLTGDLRRCFKRQSIDIVSVDLEQMPADMKHDGSLLNAVPLPVE